MFFGIFTKWKKKVETQRKEDPRETEAGDPDVKIITAVRPLDALGALKDLLALPRVAWWALYLAVLLLIVLAVSLFVVVLRVAAILSLSGGVGIAIVLLALLFLALLIFDHKDKDKGKWRRLRKVLPVKTIADGCYGIPKLFAVAMPGYLFRGTVPVIKLEGFIDVLDYIEISFMPVELKLPSKNRLTRDEASVDLEVLLTYVVEKEFIYWFWRRGGIKDENESSGVSQTILGALNVAVRKVCRSQDVDDIISPDETIRSQILYFFLKELAAKKRVDEKEEGEEPVDIQPTLPCHVRSYGMDVTKLNLSDVVLSPGLQKKRTEILEEKYEQEKQNKDMETKRELARRLAEETDLPPDAARLFVEQSYDKEGGIAANIGSEMLYMQVAKAVSELSKKLKDADLTAILEAIGNAKKKKE